MRRDPKAVFTSAYHFAKDVDLLRDCYRQTGKKKASGVNGDPWLGDPTCRSYRSEGELKILFCPQRI